MRIALTMAEGTVGQTGVNPSVGCVAVKNGRIIGLGAHLQRGREHAEVHALNMAGGEAAGCTLYVTLEPCCHHGRTPPCSERIIRENVARVVIAARDPNPLVAGGGVGRLRAHGIEVVTGVLEREAERLNERYNRFITACRPFVTMKTASTLDGKIASRTLDSKWITSAPAREWVHAERHRNQAILVGIGTVLHDDPQLTSRLPVDSLQPIRLIADSGLRVPDSAQVLQGAERGLATVMLTSASAPSARQAELEARGVRVIRTGRSDKVDLPEAMRKLAELEIASILLEGGGVLNGAMLAAGLVDKIAMFVSPKIIGGNGPGPAIFGGMDHMADAIRLDGTETRAIGDDLLITGYPVYPAGMGEGG